MLDEHLEEDSSEEFVRELHCKFHSNPLGIASISVDLPMLHVLLLNMWIIHPISFSILCSRPRQRVALVEDKQYLAESQRCEVHCFERIAHEDPLILHE